MSIANGQAENNQEASGISGKPENRLAAEERMLIIGALGQLGKALKSEYPGATAVDREDFDITDSKFVANYDWSKVDIILNAAAYTNVDGAETAEGRKLAWQINATGVGHLAKAAAQNDIALVHISSEYVFDGHQTAHDEDEPFSPLGVYAQSKAAGDIAAAVAEKHYILRTSWLIGDGPNFVRTMIGLAAKDVSPTVVNDQIGRLTFTPTLVGAISHLLSVDAPFGTYNVSNDGEPASWADVTRLILKELGRDDLKVTGTTTAEYFAQKDGAAPRPLHSSFNLDKIRSTGFVMSDWREELSKYIKEEA
ncbi:MAG TPA: NAD(P)-dependent oxidoreductase [Candidatus Saccharimonadales bacterium]|nr:NAD(P)-dependent oxidoreductase [Candidatus Saccharimonadales bacterium]